MTNNHPATCECGRTVAETKAMGADAHRQLHQGQAK